MGDLIVRFAGCEIREGPLTTGQENMMRAQLLDAVPMVEEFVPALPDGTTLRAVTAALADWFVRHEGLRTRYVLADPGVPGSCHRQRVDGAGTILVRLVDTTADTALAALEDVRAQLRARPYDVERDLPVALAVVRVDGVPRGMVIVVSHLATDGIGIGLLADDLLALIAGGPVGGPGLQPLDLVELEATPAIRRRIRQSRLHWAERLQRAPHAVLPVDDPGGTEALQRGVLLRSAAAAAAVASVSARTNATPAAVVVAAYAALLTHHTGNPNFAFVSSSSNRYLRRLRDYAGTQATDAFVQFEVDPRDTFDSLVRLAGRSCLQAYRSSWFDTAEIWAEIQKVGTRRGIDAYTRNCLFSDLSAAGYQPEVHYPVRVGAEPVVLPGLGEFVELAPIRRPHRVALTTYRLDTDLVAVAWGDPRCFADRLPAFAGALVRLLAAAGSADRPLAELLLATDLEVQVRSASWHLVDGSWVDMDAVRRLLRAAVGDRPVAVGLTGAQRPLIECHLAGAEPAAETVHAACLAQLGGRSSAMAPHRYVTHSAAPANPGDVAAWRAAPVIADSDGRPVPRPEEERTTDG
ncbi:condensation domain-containing protein [Micromonospora sp. CPCC 205539]|uniref:condensation domain-containing protein n=1 Tax=Micromonospora sp. CPCC 205539 TaxID=3122408 RepID=UPI002FEF3030